MSCHNLQITLTYDYLGVKKSLTIFIIIIDLSFPTCCREDSCSFTQSQRRWHDHNVCAELREPRIWHGKCVSKSKLWNHNKPFVDNLSKNARSLTVYLHITWQCKSSMLLCQFLKSDIDTGTTTTNPSTRTWPNAEDSEGDTDRSTITTGHY